MPRIKDKRALNAPLIEENSPVEEPSKPLSHTLVDLQLEAEERKNISEDRAN